MKLGQRGFTVIEGLLIVIVLSMVGFAGYTVWSNQDDTTDTSETKVSEDSPRSSDTETNLDDIEAALDKLAGDGDREDVVVDYMLIEDADGSSTFMPSDLYANFGNTNGLTVIDSINDAIEEQSGIAPVVEDVSGVGISAHFENSDIVCDTFANDYYARVNCSASATIESYVDQNQDVVGAASDELGLIIADDFRINYEKDSDDPLLVAKLSGSEEAGGIIDTVFLTKADGSWKYIGQSTSAFQSVTPPSCDLFTEGELELFFGGSKNCDSKL